MPGWNKREQPELESDGPKMRIGPSVCLTSAAVNDENAIRVRGARYAARPDMLQRIRAVRNALASTVALLRVVFLCYLFGCGWPADRIAEK